MAMNGVNSTCAYNRLTGRGIVVGLGLVDDWINELLPPSEVIVEINLEVHRNLPKSCVFKIMGMA